MLVAPNTRGRVRAESNTGLSTVNHGDTYAPLPTISDPELSGSCPTRPIQQSLWGIVVSGVKFDGTARLERERLACVSHYRNRTVALQSVALQSRQSVELLSRWNRQLLSHLNLVRITQLVTVCVVNTHVLVRVPIKLFADFRQVIA